MSRLGKRLRQHVTYGFDAAIAVADVVIALGNLARQALEEGRLEKNGYVCYSLRAIKRRELSGGYNNHTLYVDSVHVRHVQGLLMLLPYLRRMPWTTRPRCCRRY
jgi:hypothetical protein